ncbi:MULTISPECIES: TlpA family protein disulfide reductase [Bacillus]|uniref:TlpA family protein disulfide reductase n=1 Tax=Bacillus TaxID=1386 RepID=UPI00158442EE|nr:thioredoxin-like domain-containing protein [Bacillus glycinifermentans]MBU8785857.1 thioredoxin fold domain-containing protein [Bacillus glycinifermentans]NUJ15607.1 TlpA family protein disulfide reductase [Bacillus glycinifermentans]
MKKNEITVPLIPNDLPWINVEEGGVDLKRKQKYLFYFWSVSCINCRQLSGDVLKETNKFNNLQVIAVHVPYSEEEKSIELVKEKSTEKGFSLPIVLDQNYHIVQACHIQAVPSFCLFGSNGKLEFSSMGDVGFKKLLRQLNENSNMEKK